MATDEEVKRKVITAYNKSIYCIKSIKNWDSDCPFRKQLLRLLKELKKEEEFKQLRGEK